MPKVTELVRVRAGASIQLSSNLCLFHIFPSMELCFPACGIASCKTTYQILLLIYTDYSDVRVPCSTIP